VALVSLDQLDLQLKQETPEPLVSSAVDTCLKHITYIFFNNIK